MARAKCVMTWFVGASVIVLLALTAVSAGAYAQPSDDEARTSSAALVAQQEGEELSSSGNEVSSQTASSQAEESLAKPDEMEEAGSQVDAGSQDPSSESSSSSVDQKADVVADPDAAGASSESGDGAEGETSFDAPAHELDAASSDKNQDASNSSPAQEDGDEDLASEVISPNEAMAGDVNVRDFGVKGNGKTNDVKAINKAMYEAEKRSGVTTVYFPNGTYLIDEPINVFSNTRVVLADGATIKCTNPEGAMLSVRHRDKNGNICISSSCGHGGYTQFSNVTIEGGVWDRNDKAGRGTSFIIIARHGTNVTIKNATFINCVDHMVNLSGTKKAVVDNCIFKDAAHYSRSDGKFWEIGSASGLSPNNPEDVAIRHKYAEAIHLDFTHARGEYDAYPFDSTPSEDIEIKNCIFDNVHSGAGTHHGSSTRGNNITITGCEFRNIEGNCVNAQCFNNLTVSNCTVAGADRFVSAIISEVKISGTNSVSGARKMAVYAPSQSKVLIEGTTTIEKPLESGLYAGESSEISVLGNVVVNNAGQNGAYVCDSSALNVSGRLVVNSPRKFGVRLDRSARADLKGVEVASPGNQGFSASGASTLTVRSSRVVNAKNGYGLYADGGSLVKVISSVFEKCQQGISLKATRAGSAVTSCSITESAKNAVLVQEMAAVELSGNTIAKSGMHSVYINNGGLAKRVVLSGNTITGSAAGKAAVSIANSDVSVVSNKISELGKGGTGISCTDKAKVAIKSNTVVGKDAGAATDTLVLLNGCSNGCSVESNTVGPTSGAGVALFNTSNVKIAGNTVSNCVGHGIQVNGKASGISVLNNTSVSKHGQNNDIRINSGVTASKVENNTIGGRGVSVDRSSNATNVNNKPGSSNNSSSGSESGNKSGSNGKTNIAWSRLFGDNAYDTMQAVVKKGFTKSDTVVVATFDGYWDALSASALAGKHKAPILLTDPKTLSPATRSEINRLGAKTVYIAGGTAVVSDGVKRQIQALSSVKTVKRVSGGDAQSTATAIAAEVGKSATGIGIVATSDGYWDALAASPYAYAYKAPVFLTDATGTIRDDVVKAMKKAGVKKAVIAGGTLVVNSKTVQKLKAAGISVDRKSGGTAVETSATFAQWAIGQGMKADKMGVATTGGFYDALTGSALCGKNNSVLVLASPDNSTGVASIIKPNKSKMTTGYVFGGKFAISEKIFNEIKAASK